MISFNELLSGNTINDVPILHQQNLQELQKRVNVVREAWGQPMTVTSGYRTMQHHLQIYAKKGIFPPNVPLQSHHLYGEAVDIADDGLKLTQWLKNDPAGIACLEQQKLWCEDGNSNWAHLQIVPPKSGNRWFLP